MKQLEPYGQRMVDEYTALKTRIDSLTSFLRNEDSRSDIGLDEFRLLIEQYCAMLEYADALKKRLELHSINVEAIKRTAEPCKEQVRAAAEALSAHMHEWAIDHGFDREVDNGFRCGCGVGGYTYKALWVHLARVCLNAAREAVMK